MSFQKELVKKQALFFCAFRLGHAYKDIHALRDFAQAERWYRRSLELRDGNDRLGRGECMAQLGIVAYERFQEARNDAVQFYSQAIDLLPPNAVDDLAVTHNMLGIIYGDAGDFARALSHYRESIRYREAQGNLHAAANSCLRKSSLLCKARESEPMALSLKLEENL